MINSRSNQASAIPPMQAHLTETSATLTFINPVIKGQDEQYPSSSYAHHRASLRGLSNIQKETHPGIPDSNFVRPFSDPNNEEPSMRPIQYTNFDSAFGSMAHYAFGQHKTIILRPDDIHLLVVQGITRFLQRYPEDFRQAVVSFQGKQTVKIFMPGINDLDDWNHMPLGFAGMIRQLINAPELADLLLQDYSQTTKMDQTVKAVTLMGTFSAYFNYAASTLCHIPQFILEGTEEDWLKISSLPQKLITLLNLTVAENENGMTLLHRWLTRLAPVLQNMYLARKGVTDGAFWQNFYKFESHSGGDCVSGNIIYFYPFLKRPHWRHNIEDIRLNEWIMQREVKLAKKTKPYEADGPLTDELTANFTEVNFVLEHSQDNQPQLFEMGMKAGIVAYKESSDKKLSTHIDFSIFYKNKKPNDFNLVARNNEKQQAITEHTPPDPIMQTSSLPAPAGSSTLFAQKPKRKIQFELVLEEENQAVANRLK